MTIHKMKEVIVFVNDDPNSNEEALVGAEMDIFGKLMFTAFVIGQSERHPGLLKNMKEMSIKISKKTGRKIKILKFTSREEIGEIDGNSY